MQIDTILIGPSPSHGQGVSCLHAEAIGCKFTGYFTDMPSFLTCVSEMAQFFAIKAGKIATTKQTLSRPVLNA